MFGASGLKLVKFFLDGNSFAGSEVGVLIVGTISAFVVALIAIRFLLNYIKQNDFKAFGYYRVGLGAVVLVYFLLQSYVGA